MATLLRALLVWLLVTLPAAAQTAWQFVPGTPGGQGLERFDRAALNGGTYTAFVYAESPGRWLMLYAFDRAAAVEVGPVTLRATRRDAEGNLWRDEVALTPDRLIVRPDPAYNRLFLYIELPDRAVGVLSAFDRVDLTGVAGITTITPLDGLRAAMERMGAPVQ